MDNEVNKFSSQETHENVGLNLSKNQILLFFVNPENKTELHRIKVSQKDQLLNSLEKVFLSLKSKETWKLKILSHESFRENSKVIETLLKKFSNLKLSKVDFYDRDRKAFYYPKESKLRLEIVTSTKKRVLVVDDSKTMQSLLVKIISSDEHFEIIGTADRPSEALKIIEKEKPDLITLDIQMPEMNGVDFLKQFYPRFPIPTVMISSITKEEGPLVLTALESGAVDYIQKPDFKELDHVIPKILETLKHAANSKAIGSPQKRRVGALNLKTYEANQETVIVIGSSTGGTEAVKNILVELGEKVPPILITQHIPPVFSKSFADRLNELCEFPVKEAEDGDEVLPGHAYVAPGGFQMKIKKVGPTLRIQIEDAAPVNRHKPSVDVLFDSAVNLLKAKISVVGVILTGMGADGAEGLLRLKQAGAHTIAQDEATCVVFGMPREAIELGAAIEIKPLHEIGEAMLKSTHKTTLAPKKAA